MDRPVDRRTLLRRAAAGAGLVLFAGSEALAHPIRDVTGSGGATGSAAQVPGPAALRELRDAVRGAVVAPGDRGYDAARTVFNRRFASVRPPAVVRVRDAADVQAAVRWAGRHDVALVARSGGHGYNGGSTSATAVVIDLGSLAGVALSGGGIARVGPGARAIDVHAALARRGAAVPLGSCPTVGVGGLTTGGGMGLASRRLGLTLDRTVSIDVVTADGKLQTVDAGNDPDLYWALRGGGGAFGIVTAIRLQVHRVRRAAYFFASFPRESATEALAAWDTLAPSAPAALTAILTLPAGGGRVTVLGQHFGSEAGLRRLIAPLSRLPGARISSGVSDYLALQRRWAGCADGGLAACRAYHPTTFAASSLYVSRRLSDAGRRAIVSAARHATLVLDAYGGEVGEVGAAATAFVHRDVRFSVQILSYQPVAPARAAVRRARAAIDAYGDGAYQNYADPDLSGALRAYYGTNLPRLPRSSAQSIPTAGSARRRGCVDSRGARRRGQVLHCNTGNRFAAVQDLTPWALTRPDPLGPQSHPRGASSQPTPRRGSRTTATRRSGRKKIRARMNRLRRGCQRPRLVTVEASMRRCSSQAAAPSCRRRSRTRPKACASAATPPAAERVIERPGDELFAPGVAAGLPEQRAGALDKPGALAGERECGRLDALAAEAGRDRAGGDERADELRLVGSEALALVAHALAVARRAPPRATAASIARSSASSSSPGG